MSKVDLPGLVASKQQQSKQQASTCEMGKNQTSAVVLRILLKFWWMIPMGVKYHHTKFEQETQRWRPRTGFASGKASFQNLSKIAKECPFLASLGGYDAHGGNNLHWNQPI